MLNASLPKYSLVAGLIYIYQVLLQQAALLLLLLLLLGLLAPEAEEEEGEEKEDMCAISLNTTDMRVVCVRGCTCMCVRATQFIAY